jgi:hypothetical protein
MRTITGFALLILVCGGSAGCSLRQKPISTAKPAPLLSSKVIAETDCTEARLGTTIPVSSIGEPVSAVTLSKPEWHAAANNNPAYCSIEGSMAPVDKSSTAKPIRFGVAMPAPWSYRAAQMGGGGMNGNIPMLTGGPGRSGETYLQRGFATYGSDSGHQSGGFGAPGGGRGVPTAGGQGAPNMSANAGAAPGGQGPPGAGANAEAAPQGMQGMPPDDAGRGALGRFPSFGSSDSESNRWAINDEAIANLGYMQMKKTHDAAMVLMERIYGERPRFNYYFGSSQGGREALTVAQRYPADYDGVSAEVPIVSLSTLMLAPELIRIQEKDSDNWVTPAKVNAIRTEFMRQCDNLDGLVDGIINNYMACREIFDVDLGKPNRDPWAAKRCPNNVDPNPKDTSSAACLTDKQIKTLEMVYSRYEFTTPLANGTKSFGMWVPTTDPSGSGLIESTRYRGQEGAAENAPTHGHLGVLGVTGFLMKDLNSNPLDYVEGGSLNKRRVELSKIVDSTNPDLSAFLKNGGKMIVAVGTNDTLASSGAQLDYFQSVIGKMGQDKVDQFARFFVLPQADHGLQGRSANVDGNGKTIEVRQIPTTYDRVGMLIDWVENNKAPGKYVKVTSGERSLPMCSYPAYAKYTGGPEGEASSYACSTK